jgi:hypothetical protein
MVQEFKIQEHKGEQTLSGRSADRMEEDNGGSEITTLGSCDSLIVPEAVPGEVDVVVASSELVARGRDAFH